MVEGKLHPYSVQVGQRDSTCKQQDTENKLLEVSHTKNTHLVFFLGGHHPQIFYPCAEIQGDVDTRLSPRRLQRSQAERLGHVWRPYDGQVLAGT